MDVVENRDLRAGLDEVDQRLQPQLARSWAIARLDEICRSGSTPAPQPEGFLRGRLVTASMSSPADAAIRRITHLYQPWLGKSFDPATDEGVNLLKANARTPLKVLWPSYEAEREYADRLEAFPFRTRIGAGAIDPDVQVLKIDYDYEANPSFIIRRILDELVQIGEGIYLGKILYRLRSTYRLIGYFSLEK